MSLLILNNLFLQGFKSYNVKQSIDFSNLGHGLYYMKGKNKVDNELESNGSGKSSFWEAWCWLLNGKTSVKLKANVITNWNSDSLQCQVGMSFIGVDNKEYKLLRKQFPNALKLKSNQNSYQTTTQQEIEDLTGFDFSGFLYSTVISQFTSKFFDLQPTDKLSVFSRALKLEQWLKYSNNVLLDVRKVERELENINTERYYGELQAVQDQPYDEQSKSWKSENLKSIKVWEDQKKLVKEQVINCEEKIKKSKKNLNVLLDNRAILVDKKRGLHDKLTKRSKKVDDTNFLMGVNRAKTELRQEEINTLQGIKGRCPKCLQAVPDKHRQQFFRESKIELFEYKRALEYLMIQKEEVSASFRVVKNNYNELIKKKAHVQACIDTERNCLEESNDDYVEHKQSFQSVVEKLHNQKNLKNPFLKLIKKKNDRICVLQDKIHVLEKKKEKLQKEVYCLKFWVKGFKDIRLHILSQARLELEIKINNNLHKLGLTNWSIKLLIDSVTESGGVRSGLSVVVKNPINNLWRPFECWSGGEGQRIRLAGTIGLVDMLNDRGIGCGNIEVYDEPTQWLSNNGISSLLDILTWRAQSLKKIIVIVDHRGFENFNFKGIFQVIRNRKGSEIKVVHC